MLTFDFSITYGKRKQYWLFIVYVECPQFVQQYLRDLPFLSEKRVIDRATKSMCTICNKKLYMSNKIITASLKRWVSSKKST